MRVKSRDYADIIPAFSYDTARVMNYSVLRRTLAGRGYRAAWLPLPYLLFFSSSVKG